MYVIISGKFAETLAPGEGDELLRIAKYNQHPPQEDDDTVMVNNETVDNIKKIYDQYVIQKMPFAEQVRLLSLLPRSWTYDQIMTKFNCSRHAVKLAHKMRDDEDYYFKNEESPAIRQRVDPERVRHFITWLIDSQLLVSGQISLFFMSYHRALLLTGNYGIATLTLNSGEKCTIPKQILQSQRTHTIVEYFKYCEETNFNNLGKTKLFEILNSIKPTSQRVVSGVDEFVIEGVEAWYTISSKLMICFNHHKAFFNVL